MIIAHFLLLRSHKFVLKQSCNMLILSRPLLLLYCLQTGIQVCLSQELQNENGQGMSLHIRHSHPVCSSKAQCIVCQVDNVLLATRYFNSSQAYCGLLGLTHPLWWSQGRSHYHWAGFSESQDGLFCSPRTLI